MSRNWEGRDDALQVVEAANILASALYRRLSNHAIYALIDNVEDRLTRVKLRHSPRHPSIKREAP